MRIFFCLIICITFTSCFTSAPTKDRGSLSDAANKARDDYDGERKTQEPVELPREDINNNQNDDDDDSDSAIEIPEDPETSPNQDFNLFIGGSFGYVHPYQIVLNDYYSYELKALVLSPMLSIGFHAGLEQLVFDASGSYAQSMKQNPLRFFIGGDLHLPINLSEGLSLYGSLGYTQGILVFEFKNPIVSGSETISSDSILSYEIRVGAGILITKIGPLGFGIEPNFRFRLYASQTQEGFQNDYFGSESDFSITGTLYLNF